MTRYRIFIIVLVALVNSCVANSSLQPEEVADRLILNGRLDASDTTHVVYAGLSMTNTIARLSEAEVRCAVNGAYLPSAEEMLTDEHDDHVTIQTGYRFSASISPGDKVRLELKYGGENVFAEATVPPCNAIIESVDKVDDDKNYTFTISLKDNSPEVDYYMLKLVHRAEVTVSHLFESGRIWQERRTSTKSIVPAHSNDPILDGAYLGSGKDVSDILGTGIENVYCAFSDRKFSDATCEISFSASKQTMHTISIGYDDYYHKVAIEADHWADISVYTISKEDYAYIMALNSLKAIGYDTSMLMEDAVVPSNVSGGEGFFAIYTPATISVSLGHVDY